MLGWGMAEFIVRARGAPAGAAAFRAAIGKGRGLEWLAPMVVNALFVSQGHRRDSALTLALERAGGAARAVTLDGESLGSLPDLHERALLHALADALAAGQGLAKEASLTDQRGIRVQAIGFERLLQDRLGRLPVYLLSPKGGDIRQLRLSRDAVFVLSDQTAMPSKAVNALLRKGAQPVSLGPRVLHAAQCMTLVHNELDRCLPGANGE